MQPYCCDFIFLMLCMQELKKRYYWKRKKGRDTVLFDDICGNAAMRSGVSKKTAKNVALNMIEDVVNEIKKAGIITLPGLGTLALRPGRFNNGKFGSARPHSTVHFWPAESLRDEVYQLPPNPTTITDPRMVVQPKQ